MVSRLYDAPVALGDIESRLVTREASFRDETLPVSRLRFDGDHLCVGSRAHSMQPQALDQVSAKLGIPQGYLRKCPGFLKAENLNHWLKGLDGDVLIRFDGNEVRAVLSDRYQPVSNLEVVRTLLRTCPEDTPVRWECEARYLSLQVLRSAAERTLLGGVFVQNSETGHCTVELNALVYRVVCTNGLILSGGEVSVKRRHTRDAVATLEELRSVVSASWPNVVRHADRFDAMRSIRVPSIEPTMERIDTEFSLNEKQIQSVRLAYRVEPGWTMYDVINAYTRAGNDAELGLEERTQLQRVGGHVLSRVEGGQRWI